MPQPTHLKNIVKIELSQGLPQEVKFLPVGTWDTTKYGEVEISDALCADFVRNFEAGIPLNGVPIDLEHSFSAAAGWVKNLTHKVGDGLYATVEWTKMGKEQLTEKIFRFISAEFSTDYHDPATNQEFGAVLEGAGLTNRPVFTNLPALVFSQDRLTDDANVAILNTTQGACMKLDAVRVKDAADLSEQEKAFLDEHRAELSAEELEKLGMTEVTETNDTPTNEGTTTSAVGNTEGGEKPATVEETAKAEVTVAETTGEEKSDATQTSAVDNTPAGEQPTKVEASVNETVSVSKMEFATLQRQANEGMQAKIQLQRQEVATKVETMVFSTTNQNGVFLPKSKGVLNDFIFSLNTKQRTQFDQIIAETPKGTAKLFSELGENAAAIASGEPGDQLNTLAQGKVERAAKDGRVLEFSTALREVTTEHPEITNAYLAVNNTVAAKGDS